MVHDLFLNQASVEAVKGSLNTKPENCSVNCNVNYSVERTNLNNC